MEAIKSSPHSIYASEVILEVVNEATGEVYRRQLPLEYYENINGIRLKGEDFAGKTAEIIFLSDNALNKIVDVTGKGLDHSRCDEH